MPDEEKKTVDIDTSGPGADIQVPEDKTFENEVEVANGKGTVIDINTKQ